MTDPRGPPCMACDRLVYGLVIRDLPLIASNGMPLVLTTAGFKLRQG